MSLDNTQRNVGFQPPMMPAAAPASSQSQQPQPQAWPPNPNAAVSIRGLFKHFDRKIAVNGLALDIPIGSFYGLVGPNGAGKTTTLNMVTGLLVPGRRHRHDSGPLRVERREHGQAHDRRHAPARPDLRPTDRFAIARLLRHAARHEPRGDHASRPGPGSMLSTWPGPPTRWSPITRPA